MWGPLGPGSRQRQGCRGLESQLSPTGSASLPAQCWGAGAHMVGWGSLTPGALAGRWLQLREEDSFDGEAWCIGCWRRHPGQRPADWRPWGPQTTAGVHCVMAMSPRDQRRGGTGDAALETLKEVLTAPGCLGPGASHVPTGTVLDKLGHPVILPLGSLEARQTHTGL